MIDLAARAAVGPAARRSATATSTARVERLIALDDLVDEADAQRAHGVEAPAAREQRSRVRLADLGDDERADDRGQDAQAASR